MKIKPLHTLVAALLLPASASVYAQQHQHSDNHSQSHSAHVHGIAELLVVQEGEQLDIELHSPAMNLLGFEHRAHTPEEQQMVDNAHKRLSNVNSLFQFASANCKLTEFSLNLSAAMAADHDGQQPDDRVHHDHDEHDKHDKHGDIGARYQFRCLPPNTLDSLSTSLLQHLPGIHSLRVEWIVGGRQGATTLDNDHHQVRFR